MAVLEGVQQTNQLGCRQQLVTPFRGLDVRSSAQLNTWLQYRISSTSKYGSELRYLGSSVLRVGSIAGLRLLQMV